MLLSVPLDPVSVAMEGSRWSDEEARIREVLVHDGVVLRRARKPEAGAVNPLENRVMAALDLPDDLQGAREYRADGIGLYRSEYLLARGGRYQIMEGPEAFHRFVVTKEGVRKK